MSLQFKRRLSLYVPLVTLSGCLLSLLVLSVPPAHAALPVVMVMEGSAMHMDGSQIPDFS